MAKRIEGITIKIGADTTELNKAIRGIDSELRNTQSQLRDVNRLLKMDPGNTELLRQKQRLLGDAIGETKKKLESLKEAQEKASEALANGEINQQQYDALQREIIQTENDLKQLEQQAKETNKALSDPAAFDKFGKIGEKLQEVGGKVSDFGKSMSKNVTAPIVAMGAASMKAFSEVDKGYDTIVAKTGATGEALEEMKTSMENIAGRIPTDFETAGAAIGEVNTRFGVTGDELERLSEKFVKFAHLNNTDVSGSIDNVQKALAAYGLGAEDAEGFLDRLNKTGQETGVSVDSVTQGLISNATAFKELGLSIDEATIFMGKLEKSGANSETVLNGMRKALKNATDQGIPLDQALSDLQETILNGTGSIDGLTAAYDIFGKSGDQIYGAVKDGTINFADLAGAVTDATGSIDSAFSTTMDGTDMMKVTFNQLKIAGAELGSAIGETLAPILESLANVIKKVANWFKNLNPKTKEIIVKMALLAAAVGPVLMVVGKLIAVIGTIMSLIGAIGPVIAALTGPIGLVVAAIAGAVAAGVLLYQHWDEVKAKATEVWEGIKNVITGVIDVFASIPEKWFALWDGLRNTFNNFWQGLMENPVIRVFLQLITDELNIFSTTLSHIWENIKKIAGTAWELIKTVITTPVKLLIDLVTGDFEGLREGLKQSWTKIQMLASELWGEIKELITGFASDIFNGVKETFTHLKDNIADAWESVKSNASQVWQTVKNTVESWANSAKDAAINAFSNLASGIANALSGLYGIVRDAFSDAVDAIEDFVGDAWDWGYDLMVNFAEGIARGVTWVWDEIWDLVGWIEDMIGFSEPDKGPLSKFHTYGPDMMKLLAKGIRDNVGLVQDAVGDVAGILSTSVQGAGSNTSNYSYGPMSINVYGAEGQDVRELARLVEDRISDNMRRTGAVFR